MSATHSIDLANLVYEFKSIVEPLDLAELFPRPQPLEVELGCGDASFLAEYARQHPETNFLGVERLLGRIKKLDRKGRLAGLTNLRGVRIESAYFLQYLLPAQCAGALHIYFPDPWPKRRHHKRRFLTAERLGLLAQAIQTGGIFHAATDWEHYAQQMLEILAQASDWFENTAGQGQFAPRPASRPLTRFEQRGERLGHPVHDLLFWRR